MALKIFWTNFAQKQLRGIFDYYKTKASLNTARTLVSEIIKETDSLMLHSDIGQREELLLNRPETFRYLIYKKYKIIYWVNKEKSRIEISDIFDTRQNPSKIIRTK